MAKEITREPEFVGPEKLRFILEELKTLEPLFHAAHFEASLEKFEQLVAPDFWEVGASGNRYGRDFALKVLSERQESPDVAAWKTEDFAIAEAGRDNYLLTYKLFQPDRVTRRLSVWRRTQEGWQVIYHQGTVVQRGGEES